MLNDEVVLIGILCLTLSFMGLFLFLGWRLTRESKEPRCPYTNLPMRKAEGLPFETKRKVYEYLMAMHQYDNRPFKFTKALVCRETGRLFPETIHWSGRMHIDWHFLQKRFSGQWISWGSLSDELRDRVVSLHDSLEGFQTASSSKIPSPRQVEAKYVYLKPGPLYVDINTGNLLGWKVVPDTQLEVLIVQKPNKLY